AGCSAARKKTTGRNARLDARTEPVTPADDRLSQPESAYAWVRLGLCVMLATIGSVGMWSVVVALPAIQAEFAVTRADASLPYLLTTVGFAAGGILTGRLTDRFGILFPAIGGATVMATGYALSSLAGSLWLFALAQGFLIGGGSSATF